MQAARRSVIHKHTRISELLEMHDRSKQLTPLRKKEMLGELQENLLGIWRTNPVRRHKPSPEDEARYGKASFAIAFSYYCVLYNDETRYGKASFATTRPLIIVFSTTTRRDTVRPLLPLRLLLLLCSLQRRGAIR